MTCKRLASYGKRLLSLGYFQLFNPFLMSGECFISLVRCLYCYHGPCIRGSSLFSRKQDRRNHMSSGPRSVLQICWWIVGQEIQSLFFFQQTHRSHCHSFLPSTTILTFSGTLENGGQTHACDLVITWSTRYNHLSFSYETTAPCSKPKFKGKWSVLRQEQKSISIANSYHLWMREG